MARYTIGLNDAAIGIENMGGIDDHEDLTMAQVNANIYLIYYLKKQYPQIKYLIGHYEYGDFRSTELWLEKNANYFTTKTDPGKKFMFLMGQPCSALASEADKEYFQVAYLDELNK